jgi:cytochrome c553
MITSPDAGIIVRLPNPESRWSETTHGIPFFIPLLIRCTAITLVCVVQSVFPFAFVYANISDTQDRESVDILVQHCVRCHGADKQEGGLRLDNANAFQLGGDSGPAYISKDSQKSLLIHLVQGMGDSVMPPEGRRLTADEVQRLAGWIDRGASWPHEDSPSEGAGKSSTHWSFQTIKRPNIPSVFREDGTRNEIDFFVRSRLEREEISPADEASRQTLIRRLSFDLRGVPPTSEEVTAFLVDERVDAYEQLVDRFLAAPEFGERWARHWLDRTQFAESSGCVIDLPRPYAWRWRDWVVSAINDDLPFDEFTRYQLAGDQIPKATIETCVATGYLRNALTNHEAGIDLAAEHAKTTVDRTSMTGAAWLGLTFGCAECHSHKYDPITQRDFYSMYAFFDRIDDRELDCPISEASHLICQSKTELERAQTTYIASKASGQADWEAGINQLNDIWHVPKTFGERSLRSLGFAMVHPQADGSLTVDGRLRSKDDHYLTFTPDISVLNAVRIELLSDADRFLQGPGRCKNGDCMLTGISMSVNPIDRPDDVRAAKFSQIETDYCQVGYNPNDTLNETEEVKNKGWSVDHKGLSHAAVFTLDSPIDCKDCIVSIRLHFLSGEGRTPARFRVAVTDAPNEQRIGQSVPSDVRKCVANKPSERSESERALIKRYFQSLHEPEDECLKKWNRALDQTAQWLNPRGAETIQQAWRSRETFVHIRGDFLRRGNRVEPDIPAVFKTSDSRPTNWSRLDLANWIVSSSNPLTARVAANSIWQVLFGAGLVRTPGDFGRQGEAPTHPELLDWLADEFMCQGWSRKVLIRLIVCSSTYRQASNNSASIVRDPQNLLLARQNRFRLDAEAVRDCILHRSGVLLSQFGGPSYRGPHPDDESAEEWERATLPVSESSMFRRGLYVATPRTLPDAMLSTFDAPDGATVCPLRQRTNTPLQAMTLLNDPLFVKAATALSKHPDLPSSLDVKQRIAQLWYHCVGRSATAKEAQVLEELYQQLATEKASQSVDASKELDEWFVMARTILNLDEMVTRE